MFHCRKLLQGRIAGYRSGELKCVCDKQQINGCPCNQQGTPQAAMFHLTTGHLLSPLSPAPGPPIRHIQAPLTPRPPSLPLPLLQLLPTALCMVHDHHLARRQAAAAASLKLRQGQHAQIWAAADAQKGAKGRCEAAAAAAAPWEHPKGHAGQDTHLPRIIVL
jgi:hypothetical protein